MCAFPGSGAIRRWCTTLLPDRETEDVVRVVVLATLWAVIGSINWREHQRLSHYGGLSSDPTSTR